MAVSPRWKSGVVPVSAARTPGRAAAWSRTVVAASGRRRTSIGVRTPVPAPLCCRSSRATRTGPVPEREAVATSPMCMPRNGTTSRPRMIAPLVAAIHRRRRMARAHHVQERLGLLWVRRCGQSRRSPQV